ncbi:integrase catalytic domain-containing protein [Trichonephila clavata]|uniref:Integrase catalytic domain-containing protein n=1 Tax=Trichonephila clavata TaxID=2740835 RepID=A0A8X6FJF9_TRICU|nr:integrase catalytic domain-containing protein [Trichonephila clavata]
MSIVVKKDELKLVAEEIGLTVPRDAKRVDLKWLIEESDVFKENYEFVKTVIEQVLEEVKTQESQQNRQIELERLKLERVKAELKLAQLRTSANNSEFSLNGGETEASIDVLIKSVRTLTIKVPSTEATLTNIRTKFWIVDGRSKVKRVIKQCIKCLKVSAKGKNQMMTDLPNASVSIARVFNKVGLDFCGPFLIKLIPGRAKKSV